MRLNHEYWCELECTWQTNSTNKTATSDRLDSWASRHWRSIEQVFRSLDCFTVLLIFSTRLITRIKSFSFFGGWGGGGGCGWGGGGGGGWGGGGGGLRSNAFTI